MARRLVSLDLLIGTNVVVWQGDDETRVSGEIRSVTIQLDVPAGEIVATREKLRKIVEQLGL